MGRPPGVPSERTEQEHKKVRDRYFQLIDEAKKMYEEKGWLFKGLPLSDYYDKISEETGYAIVTIRLILADCSESNKTIRQLHKECLSLKKTSGVTVS